MLPANVLGRLERIDEARKVRESSLAPIGGAASPARPSRGGRLLLARRRAPARTKAEITLQPGVYEVDHAELFQLAKVRTRALPTEVTANGTVNPDVTRTIHVTSLGSGRVVDLKVRLGDYVKQGQTLLVITSPDLAAAMADYRKARADEELSRKALERAQTLYAHGAMAEKDVEAAQDAEDKAKVDLETSARTRSRVGR